MFSKTKYPVYRQLDDMDCGPTCLKMVLEKYGKKVELSELRKRSSITLNGVSMLGLSEASESYGLRSLPVKMTLEQLKEGAPLPCILHWSDKHFVVLFEITNNHAVVGDPVLGEVKYGLSEFSDYWLKGSGKGAALLLEPGDMFKESDDLERRNSLYSVLGNYLLPYKKNLLILFLGLIASSLINLAFPFLTQSIVDYGINFGDLGFIYVVLLAQVILFLSGLAFVVIRGWILLHVSGKLSVNMLSDFLVHLLSVKVSYFQSKHIGDITTRINDNIRVQNFLTSTSLTAAFGLVNVLVFGIVLLVYSPVIFLIFMLGAIIYVLWVTFFLKKKKQYDIQEFGERGRLQKYLIQLVTGIEDIKLNGSERKRRWEWENVQGKLYGLSIKNLSLYQKQQYGALAINEVKNIVITFYAATEVISGNITLGMMISIIYIIGQLNVPFSGLVDLTRDFQEAKLSLERLFEIKSFEKEVREYEFDSKSLDGEILLSGVTFRYGPKKSRAILDDVNLTFAHNKTTAIVGQSGSGKTTLIKLLLKFYDNYEGEILLDKKNIRDLGSESLRSIFGVVMQDGQLFNDTLISNICESDNGAQPDLEKFDEVIDKTNLIGLVKSLPKGRDTIIGQQGNSVSGGEKQRILIARALYKRPKILILDEATSALDASNENEIVQMLKKDLGCTIIVIAHRLSTVEDADRIYVLDDGSVKESGTHHELIKGKSLYYNLVKNQISIGK